MSDEIDAQGRGPGLSEYSSATLRTYLIGLFYAVILTLVSFWAASTGMIYGPGVPVLLAVLVARVLRRR